MQTDVGDTLEAFIANHLIPLNKNPGIRRIGAGEIICRIAGNVIMEIAKKDVRQTAGSLQVCAGQDAGAELAIHIMYDLFQQDETEAVLLVDAENTFNSTNRKAMLHNISIMCRILSTFVSNWYLQSWSKLIGILLFFTNLFTSNINSSLPPHNNVVWSAGF